MAEMTCRYCNKPIDGGGVKVFGYWSATPFWSHPECKAAGFGAEVLDCQTIDADCNDCAHFRRGELVKRWLSAMENDLPTMKLVNMGYYEGHCLKFEKPAIAQPNKWTGMPCFEHRRILTASDVTRREPPLETTNSMSGSEPQRSGCDGPEPESGGGESGILLGCKIP